MTWERLLFGERRRRILEWALDHHYRSLRRQQWRAEEKPHFFDHRHDVWAVLMGREAPWSLFRGYNAGMAIQKGDVVLDIGCGDGFFTSRFLGPQVDGIDIEPTAIEHAQLYNPGPRYFVLDAVSDPFPRSHYDVAVLDGAIAHLTRYDAEILLDKIVACKPRIFCGSEGLNDFSPDHHQVFDESQLLDLLSSRFGSVELTVSDRGASFEAFWRARLS